MQLTLERNQSLQFTLLAFLLIFAPLFRAGNVPLALLVIQVTAFVLAGSMLLGKENLKYGPYSALVAAGLLLVPLVYLLPVPFGVWETLPGREVYSPILADIQYQGALTLSLIPQVTEYAFWTLLPPVIVYFAVINQKSDHIEKLVYLVIAIAAMQAVLGLMQVGAGKNSALYLGNTHAQGFAVGTYLNRDHLAGFLEMVFPMVLGLLVFNVGKKERKRKQHRDWRSNLDFLASVKGHKAIIYGGISVLLILALIFTQSRMALLLVMLGLFLALVAYARRLGGNNLFGTYGTVIAIVVILAVQIGLLPIIDRFSKDPLDDLRWTIYSTSMDGVGDFFPLGSGPGTFPDVYPIYQPQDIDKFVNRVHNDYLEYLFDAGILAFGIMGIGLILILGHWGKVWVSGNWGRFRFIQIGAGIGVLLMLLHSIFDFNLHKPANAIYFAFLLAVFMVPNNEELKVKARTRKRTTRHLAPEPEVTEMSERGEAKAVDMSDW